MKSRLIMLSAFLLLFLLYGCSYVAVTVKKVALSGNTTDEGLVYALPRTVVTVQIPIKIVSKTPGALQGCADKYLSNLDIPVEQVIRTKHKVHVPKLAEATITTRGVPDPNNLYLVKVTSNSAAEQNITLALTTSGLVAGQKHSQSDKTLEIATVALQTVALLAAAPPPEPAVPCEGADDTAAVRLIEKLTKLRKLREDLTINATPKILATLRGDTLKTSMGFIDQAEKAIIGEFAGRGRETIVKKTFEFIPTPANKEFPLFKYDGLGKLRSPDFNGANLMLVKLVIVDNAPTAYVPRNIFGSQTGTRGLFYRIPALVIVELQEDSETVIKDEVLVAQFGQVASLPSTLKSFTLMYDVKFHPDTGAIEKFEFAAKPLASGSAKDAASALKSVAEAKDLAKFKQLEHEQKSLELRRKMLEDRKKIEELEQAPGT